MFTHQEFIDVAKSAAGDDEAISLESEAVLDQTLNDLGLDSLHMMAITVEIEQRHSVSLPEDLNLAALTPREVVEKVNELLEPSAS